MDYERDTKPLTIPVIVDLDALAYFHPIVFSDIDAGTDTQLAVTVDRHIEFRATSVIFPLGVSTASLETYHSSQVALVNQGFSTRIRFTCQQSPR